MHLVSCSPRIFVISALALAGLLLASAGPALAAGFYPSTASGTDVSWPQCGTTLPVRGDFGIAGVTGGRAFSQNACLQDEFQWASNPSIAPSLYMNLNTAIGTTANEGATGPKGNCKRGDKSCWNYNYGWNAAQAAFTYAAGQGATAQVWWLDIETGNSWAVQTALNRRTIEGATDGLLYRGVVHVGIYSNPHAWSAITGGWKNDLPVWFAGTGSTTCQTATSFTGGELWLVQQASAVSGGNLSC